MRAKYRRCVNLLAVPRRGVDTRRCAGKDDGPQRGVDLGAVPHRLEEGKSVSDDAGPRRQIPDDVSAFLLFPEGGRYEAVCQ